MLTTKKSDIIPGIIIVYAALISLIAVVSALKSFGKKFPSFFFDQSGIYSAVGLPSWETESMQLSRDHKIVAIDSVEVTQSEQFPYSHGALIFNYLNSDFVSDATVHMRFACKGDITEQQCPIKTIGLMEIGLFFFVYLFLAWFVLLFMLSIWRAIGEKREYIHILLSIIICTITFMISFYDAHTYGWLSPLFHITNVTIPPFLFFFCLIYPKPLFMQSFLERKVKILGFIYLLFTIVGHLPSALWHLDYSISPWVFDTVTKVSFLGTAFILLIRRLKAPPQKRRSFKSSITMSSVVIMLFAVILTLSLQGDSSLLTFGVNLLLPFVPTLFLLLVTYTIVRHNILELRTILKREILALPLFLLAFSLSFISYILIYYYSKQPISLQLLDVTFISTMLFLYWTLLKKGIDRLLFAARNKFRPTISQLSSELSYIQKEEELQKRVEKIVQGWLLYMEIHIYLEDKTEAVKSSQENSFFNVAISLHETTFGYINIYSRPNSPLLTEDDIKLLEVIATFTAIGIQNIRSLTTIDSLYRQNILLTRKGNQLSLETYSAEIAHEIRYPITYFRYLIDELKENNPLDKEDIDLGYVEIQRLEKMVAAMGSGKHPEIVCKPTNVRNIVQRVLSLLKDILDDTEISPTLHITPTLELLCDADLLTQLMSNLIKNASEAAGKGGSIEVSFEQYDTDSYALCIKDSGSGIPPEADIFSPWVSTKQEGRGIGLTVCQRIVRSFHWTLEVHREVEMTCFKVIVPKTATVTTVEK